MTVITINQSVVGDRPVGTFDSVQTQMSIHKIFYKNIIIMA